METQRKKIEFPPVQDMIETRYQYIDGTPDGGYALRILRYYRRRCDEKWAISGTAVTETTQRLYDTMCEHQDQRAVELDEAIKTLESNEKNNL